ncbi:hypothetical protein FA13DRAFT_893221 [Coprinellus micaceus]|uniref:F-box domain-containing protein n=1 Tax=Coprinellus micaceus TaxID=71717 RepID=A0A4Y7TSU5_COPMI|nr:hypothetical protein FA13DRAFT_893221 [Coprinellus micaceus]
MDRNKPYTLRLRAQSTSKVFFTSQYRNSRRALDNEIEVLAARRHRLKSAMETHRALANPIRNFPNEMLQEIFWHTLPTKHFPIISVNDAPLSLTQVCRKWRNIAFGMARLCSRIHIVPIPTATTSSSPKLFKFIPSVFAGGSKQQEIFHCPFPSLRVWTTKEAPTGRHNSSAPSWDLHPERDFCDSLRLTSCWVVSLASSVTGRSSKKLW